MVRYTFAYMSSPNPFGIHLQDVVGIYIYIYEAERINTPGHKEVNELLIKRIIISRTKHYY